MLFGVWAFPLLITRIAAQRTITTCASYLYTVTFTEYTTVYAAETFNTTLTTGLSTSSGVSTKNTNTEDGLLTG